MLFVHNSPISAKITGTTLVVAFQKSDPPLMWKFDLERNHSFTVALQGQDNDLQLGISSARGEFQPIAHFSDREAAEEAFAALQKIFMRMRQSFMAKMLMWFGAFCLLIVILAAVVRLAAALHLMGLGGTEASGPVPIKPGVAMPADQVLKPPQIPPPATQPSQYP